MLLRLVSELMASDEPDHSLQNELNVERVFRVNQTQILVTFGYTVCILVAASYLYFILGAGPDVWVMTLPLHAISLLSLGMALKYQNRPRPTRVRRSSVQRICVLIFVYGTTWGATTATFVYLFPESYLFVLLIVVGVASSTLTMLYFLPATALAFSILAVTPTIAMSCVTHPPLTWMIVLFYAAYFFTSGISVFNSFRVFRDNLSLGLDNKKLLASSEQSSQVKADFIASMSHEIRTPLNAISGYAQILKLDNLNSNPKTVRGLENVLDASMHLLSIVDQILEVSKFQAGDQNITLELMTPSDVFRELIPMIKSDLESKNLIWEGVKKSGKYIEADRQRLRQILLNLVNNAIKYTPECGKVEFGCFDVDDATLRIYVTDTGIGIPETEQAQVFQQFFRASNVRNIYSGTGLGLYHSKELVDAMGGTMSFESQVAGGTTFYVDFPIADNQ